jgi:transcriptional regulator with XRE-family HTH domain
MTLADLLRQEMDRRGIVTTMELGKEIGVGQGTAWRLLNKGSVPREDTLAKIARFLRLSITWPRTAAESPAGHDRGNRLTAQRMTGSSVVAVVSTI